MLDRTKFRVNQARLMSSRTRHLGLDTLVVGFTLLVFSPYLSGEFAPPWDFWGGYLTNAHSWWDLGGLFQPPSFLPYLGGSPPAHLSPQAGQWYLPIGTVFLLFGGYTPIAAAVLQALTVAFGVMGARRVFTLFGYNSYLSILGSLGYLFSAGFFGNAQHNDIVRGWALIPWALIFLLTIEKNGPIKNLVWSIFWFQFFVGIYPGMIVSSAFSLTLFFVVQIFIQNRNNLSLNAVGQKLISLTPLALGFLMSLIKWLPFLGSSGYSAKNLNQLVFDFSTFTTLAAPFVDGNFSNNVTMRTIFLLPIVWIAIPFALVRIDRALILGIMLVVSSLSLGLTPELQFLDVSRYRFSDFKPFLQIGLILLGLSGLRNLFNQTIKPTIGIFLLLISISLTSLVLSGSYLYSTSAGFALSWAWIGLTYIFLGVLWAWQSLRKIYISKHVVGITLLVAALAIGASWAQSSSFVWLTSRESTERHLFQGMTATDLISDRRESGEFRGSRTKPASPDQILSQAFNWGEYSRQYFAGGYINMKGVEIYGRYYESAQNNGWLYNFVSQSPSALVLKDAPDQSDRNPCSYQGCLDARVTFWSPGEIIVELELGSTGTLVTNELNYRGWSAEGCNEVKCVKIENTPETKSGVLAANLQPSNNFRYVKFNFEAPLKVTSEVVSSLAAVFAVLVSIISTVRLRFKLRRGNTT